MSSLGIDPTTTSAPPPAQGAPQVGPQPRPIDATTASARSPFERVFAIGRRHGLEVLLVCLILAGGVHGALGAVLVHKKAADDEAVAEIVDIDITTPAPAKTEEPPPPPPPPEPVPTAAVATSPRAPDDKPTLAPPPPPLGALGKLLADDKPVEKKAGEPEPYTFNTDPDGKEFSGGTSGVGGGPDPGLAGGKTGGVPGGTGTGVAAKGPLVAPAPPKPESTVDRSRAPKLSEPNACRGFFPADADDDTATVQLLVTVQPNGKVASATVLSEDPKGQGFGRAARTCLMTKTFDQPALDRDGTPIAKSTTVNLKFVRY
ncbi:MAG: hypothetical protein NVSMB47_18140 [Polyangiales bacterium]